MWYWYLLGAILVVGFIGLSIWDRWPDDSDKLCIKQTNEIAVLTVLVETLVGADNDAINRLRLLAESDTDIDTAVADLIWARDYTIERLKLTTIDTILTAPDTEAKS